MTNILMLMILAVCVFGTALAVNFPVVMIAFVVIGCTAVLVWHLSNRRQRRALR